MTGPRCFVHGDRVAISPGTMTGHGDLTGVRRCQECVADCIRDISDNMDMGWYWVINDYLGISFELAEACLAEHPAQGQGADG